MPGLAPGIHRNKAAGESPPFFIGRQFLHAARCGDDFNTFVADRGLSVSSSQWRVFL